MTERERLSPAELDDLKARNPCDELAGRLVKLRAAGARLIGPCPLCSPDPTSRDATRFEVTREGWTCAACCDGGDVIALVQRVNGCDFLAAVEILGGKRAIDPAEAERAAKARAAIVAERERQAKDFRERERRKLWGMWQAGLAIVGTPVADYLHRRGVRGLALSSHGLRCLADCPMYADGSGKLPPIHRGPAMLAAIVGADGRFCGLHITWIDLAQAKGKAIVADPATGEILPAKKVRGSKSGGHIELVAREAPRRLIIGEGIETVASVAHALGLDEQTAFWTSVDLGNLGGRAAGSITHPTLKNAAGRALRIPGPLPDPASPAIPIPETVDELVLLGDGDSDAFTTGCALSRAAARYARPGRAIKIAWAPAGVDFNDLASEGGGGKIAEIIAQAKPAEEYAREREQAAPPSPQARARKARASARDDATPPVDRAELDLRLAFYPLTDLGNAERFRDRWRGRLFFCRAIGWHFWDGKRWSRNGAEERAQIAAHETIRAINDEAAALEQAGKNKIIKTVTRGKGKDKEEKDVTRADLLRQWAIDSESNSRLNAIADQAAAYLSVSSDDLDKDADKINCQNGTLEVRKRGDGVPFVRFYGHDPRDLITKIIPVEYNPAAECPLYDQFLVDVQPNADARRFLHQWLGLSLTGDISEQKLCVWWGKGKNGKSVLQDTVAFVAGDYSETVPIETFLTEGRGRSSGQATPDLAILPGVRLLRTSEPKRNAPLDEALVKLATGGEQLQVRHLNRDYFKFYPQFKLTISGNYRPKIEGSDEGIWRRVILFPWRITISEDKRDLKLTEKLRAEGAGILNRLLDGLCDKLEHGLKIPDDAAAATADYRDDSDPLGRFLEACTEPAAGDRVQSTAMHELFCAWAKANAATEWTAKGLSMALKERGLRVFKSSVAFWLDVKLTRRPADFIDAHGRPIEHAADAGGPAKPAANGDDVISL